MVCICICYVYAIAYVPQNAFWRSAFPFWRSAFQNELFKQFIFSRFELRFVAASWVRFKRVSDHMFHTGCCVSVCVLNLFRMLLSFKFQFHGQRIVAPLSRMTSLVLQISTPPVQFDIVIFAYVLKLRFEYVLKTLLTTRLLRFAAFWLTF